MTSPEQNKPLARLSHVTFQYEHGTVSLDNVSFELFPGEHVCVLGANGSGKSTLASVLAGLAAPDAGSVELVGNKVCRDGHADFDAYRQARKSLGLVFQNPDDQLVTSVVADDVAFGPENLGVAPEVIDKRVERELKRVAMSDYAQADPARLSGGQKQRVAIAGALAMEPQLLVLDEPGALLDVRGRTSIMRVIKRLHGAGVAIVHVTHFMDEALAADRVLIMSHGRIAREGTPQDVFAEPLNNLGLEAPFAARLSERLQQKGVPITWTCQENTLVQELAALASKRLHASVANNSLPEVMPQTPVKPTFPTSSAQQSTDKNNDLAVLCDHVSYSYAPNGAQGHHRALDDVSFAVPAGTTCAIVGQTGSGKSTLLRLLCALEKPDEGRVVVLGIETARKRNRRRLYGHIGYVMQRPERQLFAQTVFEDVAFGPNNLKLSQEEIQQRAGRALELVGLSNRKDASPFELSGGQRRLCALAGILAMEPTVLLLDEPTAGLDPHGRHELETILKRVHESGVTLITVTHSMDDAAQADQVVVLDRSRVLMNGTPEQVFSVDNQALLKESGLGLPHALSCNLSLQAAGIQHLGNPLNMETLANRIANNLIDQEVR